MCELLVRIVDKANLEDPGKDAQCMKRGDVVVALPDGWGWTERERTNPDWRIFSAPTLPLAEGQSLTTPEPGDPRTDRMLQRRAFRIDFDRLTPSKRAEVLAPRGDQHIAFSAAEIRSARVQKAKLEDPFKVGSPSAFRVG